ncbi:MAG: UvrD-helicase domain-containing protein [Ardenticatenaceae bacterium]|nr:UvrD-helicase domain-containing protein [Ardenticatenaceae bacterium]
MSHWDEIKRQARAWHATARARANGDSSAKALIAAAAQITGIKPHGVPAVDSLLDGGEAVLDPASHVIWFNQDVDPELATFYIGHEYAHFWLHGDHTACSASDVDPEITEGSVPPGVHYVEGYNPEERQEREANVFAREFFLPAETVRQWYIEDHLDATAIAARVGLPDGLVFHQLARALLTSIPSDGNVEDRDSLELHLDPSQEEAARVNRGPFLAEAGPGTGKTRTLVGRIIFLLEEEKVLPSAILALTFSNKAAEEMRERVARVVPEAAPRIWVGTFHAFGLELLRKFGSRLGLPPRLTVIDPVDALFRLERLLPSLPLDHYRNLYEPTTNLRYILAAISRAKDELVGPAAYVALAEQMLAAAQADEAREAAERALEVARVYAIYQDCIEREYLLDFGDLIFRTVMLLRAHSDIREYIRQSFRHVLVDEYQDVNRASGLLLCEIAGEGAGLWVVGDARQAIYRFRGAAPDNMRLFPADFPGATVRSLGRNYRSQPSILKVVGTLAPQMRATRGTNFIPWEPARRDGSGRVLMEVAVDQTAEGVGLAREIERQRAAGIPYCDQAVLCRSHTLLARIATYLEQTGIPILYLGDLFERHEIRDLLALMALAAGDRCALVRVARFAEYQIPLLDVQALLELAGEQDVPFPRALNLAQEAETISAVGKAGLVLLARHLDGLCYGSTAWGLLVRYLFVRSQYLRPLLNDSSVGGQQRRLAVFQFLQFAHEQRKRAFADDKDPKRAFLEYVRRLEIFGEERQLREVPE